jgi:mRNA-degrading endonuclease RelE of RelBE toxin-antitoxin system
MHAKPSSTRTRSSKPSTKPPGPPAKKSGATAGAGDRPWRVRLHPKVAKQITGYIGGAASPLFRPTIGSIIAALKTDPKQYPKKKGPLKDARAADLRYNDGVTYRAVFTIDEAEHAVDVLALDQHDKAYQVAKNRV